MSFRDRFPVLACWLGKKRNILSTLPYRKKPPQWSIKTYKKKYGIVLDLKHPISFYEKMNYWKHNYYDERQTALADKLLVKKILTENKYGDLCAKTYFYSDNIRDLKKWFYENKNKYKSFVFKTNHSCGDVYIYNNGAITKKNGRKIKKISTVFKCLNIGLHYNHYYTAFEMPYKRIKPYVFVEEYIDFDESTIEYELMYNYGHFVGAKVVQNRQDSKLHVAVTVDDKFIIINKEKWNDDSNIKIPSFFSKMDSISKQFGSFAPFCRCDFIINKDRLYFCEFTFVKSGGMDIYTPKNFNIEFGQKFNL